MVCLCLSTATLLWLLRGNQTVLALHPQCRYPSPLLLRIHHISWSFRVAPRRHLRQCLRFFGCFRKTKESRSSRIESNRITTRPSGPAESAGRLIQALCFTSTKGDAAWSTNKKSSNFYVSMGSTSTIVKGRSWNSRSNSTLPLLPTIFRISRRLPTIVVAISSSASNMHREF